MTTNIKEKGFARFHEECVKSKNYFGNAHDVLIRFNIDEDTSKYFEDLDILETSERYKVCTEDEYGVDYFMLSWESAGDDGTFTFSNPIDAGLWACKRLEVATHEERKGSYKKATETLMVFLTALNNKKPYEVLTRLINVYKEEVAV